MSNKRTLFLLTTAVITAVLFSCNQERPKENSAATNVRNTEIRFLSAHRGKTTSETGYFSNQIVSRRLHNLLKSEYETATAWLEIPFLVEGNDEISKVIARDSSGTVTGFFVAYLNEDAIAFGWRTNEGFEIRREYSSLALPEEIQREIELH